MVSLRLPLLSLVVTALGLACAPPASAPAEKPAAKTAKSDDKEPAPTARREQSDDDEEGAVAAERKDPTTRYEPTPRTTELKLSDAALEGLLGVARAGCDGKSIDSVPTPTGLPSTSAPSTPSVPAASRQRVGDFVAVGSQSVAETRQRLPTPQRMPEAPPQSTSVSVPLLTLSPVRGA